MNKHTKRQLVVLVQGFIYRLEYIQRHKQPHNKVPGFDQESKNGIKRLGKKA